MCESVYRRRVSKPVIKRTMSQMIDTQIFGPEFVSLCLSSEFIARLERYEPLVYATPNSTETGLRVFSFQLHDAARHT